MKSGHQVDGHDEVAHQRSEQELAAARDARVAQECAHQDEAVGDEADQGAGVAPVSREDEGEDKERVEGERGAQPGERRAQVATLLHSTRRMGTARHSKLSSSRVA